MSGQRRAFGVIVAMSLLSTDCVKTVEVGLDLRISLGATVREADVA